MSVEIQQLAGVIAASQRIAVFTGAGVSTESGIPDFRSPGGVWDRYAPIQFQEFLADPEARRETWRRGLHTYPVVAAAQPNAAHLALVDLERAGRLVGVVTQNIDGLHARAGLPTERIVELHGNAHAVRCLQCEARSTRDEVHARVERGEAEPRCHDCGGVLKPATISFGESMPWDEVARAERIAAACDLMLVIGSSLVVFPAAAIPARAVELGALLAIVNLTETHLDRHAELVVRAKAAEVLPPAVRLALRR